MSKKIEAIKLSVEIPHTTDKAFQLFTSHFGDWWPVEYTWSQHKLESIGIEPHLGGRCTEIGPNNFQIDWGRVLVWQPDQRLQISWHIGSNRVPQPDPDQASTIDVLFTPINTATTSVQLIHGDMEKHGEGAEAYRDAMASDYGWPFILEKYLSYASSAR